ncbi:MAG: hypothetical protein IJD26_03125 [Lachnospiraceae bacterium]|nr:hypothetical protein [Lachnospiraceae bacterium]
MRKKTKFLVTASVFAAAMNMNGCGAYGPPPEGYDDILPTVTTAVENFQIIAEPPDWYFSAMGQYAVVRLLSVEETKTEDDTQTEALLCGIEILSIYNPRLDLGLPSELIIPGKDVSSFSVGDVLFVELGPMKWTGEAYTASELIETENGVVLTPFADNRLVLTEEFTKSFFYESLAWYNEDVHEYRLSVEKGEDFFMEFGNQSFEEGMTTEETETFFREFEQAKKDYEVVLNRINGGK